MARRGLLRTVPASLRLGSMTGLKGFLAECNKGQWNVRPIAPSLPGWLNNQTFDRIFLTPLLWLGVTLEGWE